MRMTEIDFEAQPPIDSYGAGGFRVAGQWYAGGLIILPEGPQIFSGPLDPDTVQPVLAAGQYLDVVLIGQGSEIAPLPRDLRAKIEASGPGVEVMSTPSACRTYNVLLTEDRRVAVVLMPV